MGLASIPVWMNNVMQIRVHALRLGQASEFDGILYICDHQHHLRSGT